MRPLCGRLAHAGDRDGHPADGVDRLDELDSGVAPGMTPGDELGEDCDGDLLLARGAEVESGGAADAGEGLLVEAPIAEVGEDGDPRFALATRPMYRPRRRARPPAPPRPPGPSRRRRRRLHAPRARSRHANRRFGRGSASVRAAGAVAENGDERRGQLRLHEHFDRALREPELPQPVQAGLSVGRRREGPHTN